ncbi:MAG: transposase, partial [Streptomyces sp.]|nr:transposase [Streptomyces sp.]
MDLLPCTLTGRAVKFLRRPEEKPKCIQEDLSRKANGSNNRNKVRKKVARQHARLVDRRRGWQRKLSTQIRDSRAAFAQTLLVNALGRNRPAKSVHDARWAQFVDMLECKVAAEQGRTFAK